MKYLNMVENLANDLEFNGFDFNTILIIVIIFVITIYIFVNYFSYWFNPDHPHKVSRTIEEYYEHIKEYHPDIWEEYNLTNEGIKEFIQKLRDNENESE